MSIFFFLFASDAAALSMFELVRFFTLAAVCVTFVVVVDVLCDLVLTLVGEHGRLLALQEGQTGVALFLPAEHSLWSALEQIPQLSVGTLSGFLQSLPAAH